MTEIIVVPVVKELYLPVVMARALLEAARSTVDEAGKNLRIQEEALFDSVAPKKVKEYNSGSEEKHIGADGQGRYVGELTGDGRFMVFRIVHD